jgi:hypothetical protein
MSLADWWMGLITALLAPIAAAIIIKVIDIQTQPKRQVTYEVTSSIRVLNKEVARQIRSTFNRQSISNAQLISFRVKNTGKEPIEPGDYIQGTQIRFSFGNDARPLAVDQTNAPNTSITIDDAGRVSLAPFRLDTQESVTLDILVTDFRDEIIVDKPQFNRPRPGEQGVEQKVNRIKVPLFSKSPLPGNIFFTFIILTVVSFLLLIFAINPFIYENFYNEHFPFPLSNIFYLSIYVASFIAAIMISITHIVSNYFSPLEVGAEHQVPNNPRQTILRMDEPSQRFPLINYVWTIFAFLIIAPLIYFLLVAALEIYIDTYIYVGAYPDSYVRAYTNSALWSGIIITVIMSIITRLAMNEYLHKRYLPLKQPAITPKISRDFRSPLTVQSLSFPLEIPQRSGIPSLNVKLERIDFYQPDEQNMKWTFTLSNTTSNLCRLSVPKLELENTAQGRFDGHPFGVGDITPGQTGQITASFPLPQLNQPYTLHLVLACGANKITYVDQDLTFGVTYQMLGSQI